MNLKKFNIILKRAIGYASIIIVIGSTIYIGYKILDLFSIRLSERYILKQNDDKNIKANKVFLLKIKEKENRAVVCGYINNIRGTDKKIDVTIFPEFTHLFNKGDTIYYFKNDIINILKILPLEAYSPLISRIFSTALNDAGRFLETPRFNNYYKPRLYSAFERSLKATMDNPDIKNRYNQLIIELKQIAMQVLGSQQMNDALKRLASRDAALYLTKSGCIILRKPYIKDECMGVFFKHFMEDLFNDPTINAGLGELPPKIMENKNLQNFIKVFPGVLIANLSSDKELGNTLKQLINDPELASAFSRTLAETKKFTNEELPKILYQGRAINPVIMLFVKETVIYRERGFWFKFDSTDVPEFLINSKGTLE